MGTGNKTNKSVAKRFRKTKRGKIVYNRPGKSHLLGGKTRKRKRQLRGSIVVDSKKIAQQIASKLAH
jgi:large subunit ribosomal protein L35